MRHVCRNLSAQDTLRASIIDEGVLPLLLVLLSSDDPAVGEVAAATVTQLASSGHTALQLAGTGIIPKLLELLSATSGIYTACLHGLLHKPVDLYKSHNLGQQTHIRLVCTLLSCYASATIVWQHAGVSAQRSKLLHAIWR